MKLPNIYLRFLTEGEKSIDPPSEPCNREINSLVVWFNSRTSQGTFILRNRKYVQSSYKARNTVKSSLCYVTQRVRRRTRTTVQGVATWPAGDRPVGETEDEKTGMQHVGHHSPTWEAGRNRPATQPRIDLPTFAPLQQHSTLHRVGLVATGRRPITEFSRVYQLGY